MTMTMASRMKARRNLRSGCSTFIARGTSASSARSFQTRFGHLAQVQHLVELLLADAFCASELPDRLACPHRLLGELGRLVVPDHRVQRGGQHRAPFDELRSAI